MISYVKFACGNSCPCDAEWYKALDRRMDLFDYIVTLNPNDQLRFVLDQSLALSYFFWMYGPRAHEMITSYSQCLKEFTETRVAKNNYTEIYATLFNVVRTVQMCWYGNDWIDLPIRTVGQFLFDLADKDTPRRHPVAMTNDMIIPYIMHRNHKVQEGFSVWVRSFDMPRFTIDSWYSAGTGRLSVGTEHMGTNFYARLEDCFRGTSLHQTAAQVGNPYLVMLMKCTLSSKNFTEILRGLSWRRLDCDPYAARNQTAQLFYATAAILNDLFSADFLDIARDNGICPVDPEKIWYKYPVSMLFTFLSVLNKSQGVKINDREIFVKFFSAIAQKQKSANIQQVVEFVRTEGTNVASAECLKAFKASELGACEAIELISQQKSVIAQEVGSGTDETEDEPEEDDETNIDLSDLPEREDAKPGLEADEVPEEDQDTSTDDDEGEDDSSSQDGGGGDDGDPDNSEGEDPNQDGGTSGDDPAAANANDTQANAEPEKIDAQDKSGIMFEVMPEGAETVDSVMFREELDAWITDVLTNPPKKLSPQQINALTVLQKCWLHLLSVETITGILESFIALPDKFKKIKNSKE